MDNQKKQQVLVVGGGIAGLSTAYYIMKYRNQHQLPVTLTLVERAERLGGKIRTTRIDDCIMEEGPDSFIGRKTIMVRLSQELGIDDELVGTNPKARKNYILLHGKMHLMPPGLMLGIPTQFKPFVKTGLVSPMGKLRAGMDLVLPRGEAKQDESLGGFLQRRLGKEVAECLAEPLLSGIYAGDTQKLSLMATFPNFRTIEQEHRSLIKGMMFSRKPKGPTVAPGAVNSQVPQASQGAPLPPIVKKSVFLSYGKGFDRVVTRLEEELRKDCEVKTGVEVQRIERAGEGYEVTMSDGVTSYYDNVVLATPTFVMGKLLPQFSKRDHLLNLPYVTVANVALGFERKEVHHPLDASGFVIPRTEGRKITACTFISVKWPHTASDDKVVLRVFIGHAGNEADLSMSDEEFVQIAREELRELTGIDATPLFHKVNRWPQSMPQYNVGHLERMAEVEEAIVQEYPGLYLTGSGFYGVGVPDCVTQGEKAARKVLKMD
ncbi:protoporphyrinogen oxidase [Rubeoparvulum massiliense]|uniref:protoporphyrinogen oxidase n=1 Tax=Rubeoparvulum massiliense TaxID=1631346 RepID=UPI00065DD57C|nr:protoporphyrinogen oxidase [Rubeoparvulum massiliense]